MRSSRTAVISILAVGLTAGSAVGIAAQDEEAATEPDTPAIATGYIVGVGELVQGPTEAVMHGIRELRGFVVRDEQIVADDPRLGGSLSASVNMDWRTVGDLDVVVQSIEQRIDNEGGSWSGSCTALAFANDGRPDPSTCLLSGSGAYDGLTAYVVTENREEPPHPFEALIFAGEVPPTPEAPPAE